MAKFNFTPFSDDPLTHRVNYIYMPGHINVSSPANYSTDADAIQAAETLREDAHRVEVQKYTETPTGRKLVTIYQN